MPTSANALYGSPKREISVILPVLNEEKYLEDAVNAILAQQYDGEIEVILAIGPSQDKTLEIAQRLHMNDSRVVIVENPTGRTAAGLNRAIAASQYSIIVRVDGHAKIPQNYLTLAVEIIEMTGAVNVGGVMAAEGVSTFEKAVARAMRSPLGVGASRFHTGGEAGEVDTVYLGAFKREAINQAGGFDERYIRAQDWELNHRMRKQGGLIWFDPRLIVTYRPRNSFSKLAKQYFQYGRWRRVISRQHPKTTNFRYLAPPIALVINSLSVVLGVFVAPIFLVPVLIYVALLIIGGVIIGRKIADKLLMSIVFATMHLSWGIGFITSPKNLLKN